MAGSSLPSRLRRLGRLAFSLLLVGHFVALLAYPAPRSPGAFSQLPDPARTVLDRTIPPVVAGLEPLADPYLRALSLEQHWRLFGPDPMAWTLEVEGVVYGGHPGEEAGGGHWRAERVRLPAPLDHIPPRILRARESYLLLKAGQEADAGTSERFRRAVARWVCQEAAGRVAWAPEGVRLRGVWHPVELPWRPLPEGGSVSQDLGGFPCPA